MLYEEYIMHKSLKNPLFYCVAICILLMGNIANAKDLKLHIYDATAGEVRNGKQHISFSLNVKNRMHGERLHRLNFLQVEITGRWGNGHSETYRRKVKVNHDFYPPLHPGRMVEFTVDFHRKVNPHKNMFRYKKVKIRILKYNYE